MNQDEAQQEVQNVIKEAYEKEKEELEKEQAKKEEKEEEKSSIGKVMLSVFKSKQEFIAFINFIKNGFKS